MSEMNAVLDELMMAQQPIFNRNKELFGYELLFRDHNENCAEFDDSHQATSQVIVNLCIGITELEAQLRQPFLVVWKNIPYRRANSVPGCECSKLTLGHLP
ncbi:hypothetical protein FJM67_13915, partial [Maribrevibacterium harenarium]